MNAAPEDRPADGPLEGLEQWTDDVRRRFSDSSGVAQLLSDGQGKREDAFRDYRDTTPAHVREFYLQNHQRQTVDLVREKTDQYGKLQTRQMGVWEALQWLNEMVDQSDPDNEMPQIVHAIQTAEAIRRDGHPGWFVLTGLIHDLGKVLSFFGEPQWAVVGDTFPVGCAFSDQIVFSEFFEENPDSENSRYQTECGVYSANCGLDNVLFSWGHDEYMHYVAKPYLPPAGLAMIRYHSCYAWHQGGAYTHLMDEFDDEKLQWVRAFSRYDLYTKDHRPPDVQNVAGYYQALIDEYFPSSIDW